MHYKILVVVVIIIALGYLYYHKITETFVSLRTSISARPVVQAVPNERIDKDCEMTPWTKCDPYGKQQRTIISGNVGLGKKCEPLVQKCTILANVSDYQPCVTSNQCKNTSAFCRVGDHRCLTDGECSYANSMDKTKRNCTRMDRLV
jgi:hypothetical protein